MTQGLELMNKQLERFHIISKIDTMHEYRNWSQKLPAFDSNFYIHALYLSLI